MLRSKIYLALFTLSGIYYANANPTIESGSLTNTQLAAITEQQQFDGYTGIPGTAPHDVTVTSTGAAIEQTPGGVQDYLFFTQTLANGIYYEGRIYSRYNFMVQNPIFPNVPASNENPPLGYGIAFKLGYNFHVSKRLDITPYLRVNGYNNMSIAYADTNGDKINSTTLAILPGAKFTFKMTSDFNPYIDLYGGYQQVALSGTFIAGPTPNQNVTANVNQIATTTEIGFAYKVSDYIAIIPYIQNIITNNGPDDLAAAPYTQGGFNIAPLTTTQQVFGLKLNVSWY